MAESIGTSGRTGFVAGTVWIIDEEWNDYEIEEKLVRKELPGCDLRYSKKDYLADLESFGKYADAVLCQIDVDFPKAVIGRLENCQIISVYGTGYDNIDVDAAREKNIVVTNVPAFCVPEVSDHIIAFIYHFSKKVATYKQKISMGLWGINAVDQIPARLSGSILFIIGFGNIGKALAKKAVSLGLEVIVHDPYVSEDALKLFGVRKVSWDDGFQNADFVSIATRLTPQTREMVGMTEFKMMKKEAVLINTARGEIIKENDLLEAVNSGLIAGAGLDVTAKEPPDSENELLKCEKILLTPHVSYLSCESLRELREKALRNIIITLKGKKIETGIVSSNL
jgi:D-3-phosphoglycerate dehydrogenase / 2-oxoglutarate reductase